MKRWFLAFTLLIPCDTAEAAPPVNPGPGIARLSTRANAAIVFPHFVQGGGFQTSFTFNNYSRASATIVLDFYSQSGSLTGSTSLPISGLGSSGYSMEGSTLTVGWARASASTPIDITASETIQSSVTETSFAGSSPDTTLRLPVLERDGLGTGVALVNLSDAASAFTFTLRNSSGAVVNSTSFSLAPHQQTAQFVSEVFGGLSNFEGALEITSLRTMAATAFRINLTSGAFGAVPVSPIPTEAFFSPHGGIAARIIQEIERAQATIDVAIYSFTRSEIANALIAAKRRGLAIRVLADNSEAAFAGSNIAKLEAAGVLVKRTAGGGGGILHDKFAVFDGRLLLTGSYNWTTAAEDNNDENAVFLRDASVVAQFEATFNSIWSSR